MVRRAEHHRDAAAGRITALSASLLEMRTLILARGESWRFGRI